MQRVVRMSVGTPSETPLPQTDVERLPVGCKMIPSRAVESEPKSKACWADLTMMLFSRRKPPPPAAGVLAQVGQNIQARAARTGMQD